LRKLNLQREGKTALSSARAVASNPTDSNLSVGLTTAQKNVADALVNLLQATKGSQTGAKDLDEAIAAIAAVYGNISSRPG
jgi:hypothetical protein